MKNYYYTVKQNYDIKNTKVIQLKKERYQQKKEKKELIQTQKQLISSTEKELLKLRKYNGNK